MYIFYGMPKKIKLKTICAPCFGKTPEQVMAPAVADAHKLGYGKLYKLLLDHVSCKAWTTAYDRRIYSPSRPSETPSNCIHWTIITRYCKSH